jgi:MFS family permease
VTPSRIAVKLVFFINGFVHANLASRFPRIQELFQLDNGMLGLILLCSSLGALLAMPFTGWLVVQNGSRRVGIFAVFAYCLILPVVPFMSGFIGLASVFFLMGVTAGMLDISMNAQAIMIEQQLKKPIMTSFHALFSIGMGVGALTGVLFIKLQSSLMLHFTIIVVASVIGSLWARYHFVHDKPKEKSKEGQVFRLPNSAMVGIGIIAFCSMLGEGAMVDWSTNYMEHISLADKVLAPMALASFSLAMTIGRLFGDSARARFGDRLLMIYCGLTAAIGMGLSIIFIQPYAVIIGFFIVGLGLSVIVPIAYSIAGNTKGLPSSVGLAMVTTVGYSGFLFGPPIIGFLADWQTLRIALLLVVVLFITMTVLSVRYERQE